MRQEIRICGFGGQGIITAGIILAKAAALEGFEVLQTQSYGSEARGGACKADVTVSDEKINDLLIEEVDVLVCMSNVALAKYLATLKPKGILLIDSDLVTAKTKNAIKIPATGMAGRNANIAMVAALASMAGLASLKSIEAAISDTLQNPGEAINAAKAAYNTQK